MAPVDCDSVLGSLLQKLRINAALTVDEAAVASGLSATRIAGVEEGDGQLLLGDAVPLLHAYAVPLVTFAARFERDLVRARRRAHLPAHAGEEGAPAERAADLTVGAPIQPSGT